MLRRRGCNSKIARQNTPTFRITSLFFWFFDFCTWRDVFRKKIQGRPFTPQCIPWNYNQRNCALYSNGVRSQERKRPSPSWHLISCWNRVGKRRAVPCSTSKRRESYTGVCVSCQPLRVLSESQLLFIFSCYFSGEISVWSSAVNDFFPELWLRSYRHCCGCKEKPVLVRIWNTRLFPDVGILSFLLLLFWYQDLWGNVTTHKQSQISPGGLCEWAAVSF